MKNNKSPSYKIGQIIYILSDKTNSIIPAMIVEKTIVEKITGNSISWKVRIGDQDKNKTFDLSSINSDVYLSLDEVIAFLRSNSEQYLAELQKETILKTAKWFPDKSSEQHIDVVEPINLEQQIIELSESGYTPPTSSKQPTEPATLRDRLKMLVTPSEEEIKMEDVINE